MKPKSITTQILIALLLITFSNYAQTTTVHGKITVFKDIAVGNAEILIKKNKTTVFSDSLGHFSIACKLKDKISIKAAGFKAKSVKVRNLKDSLNVNLEIIGEEEGITLAATSGHIDKSKLALAKKRLTTKEPYSLGYTNMTELILGKFPNISIVGDELILRGKNSVEHGNGALIIINGSTYSWGQVKSMIVTNIKDIKILNSLEASRYGTGSGNGVIMIRLLDGSK